MVGEHGTQTDPLLRTLPIELGLGMAVDWGSVGDDMLEAMTALMGLCMGSPSLLYITRTV